MANVLREGEFRYAEGNKSDRPQNKKEQVVIPVEESAKYLTEIEAMKKEVGEFIEQNQAMFFTFAKDVSLRFKPVTDGFKIDLKKGEIHLDMNWFRERDCSLDQIIWACFHELSHFSDLASDPEGMMKQFDYTNNKGGESRAYHTFYNVFDDIFVNRKVASRAPAYSPDTKAGLEIRRLYQEKLFKDNDYSKIPRHLQFLYALLRPEMVPEENVLVSEDVQKVLDESVRVFGRSMTLKKFVDTFIQPTVSSFKPEENLPARRYQLLKKHVEPIFAKFLKQDQDDPNFKKQKGEPGEGEPGEGEPGEGEPTNFNDYYDKFDKNSPDQISETDMKDWAKGEQKKQEAEKAKAKKDAEEASKSPKQKADDAQRESDDEFAQKYGIVEEMRDFRKIENKIAPYLDQLSQLWQSIVYGRSEEVEIVMEGFYKSGSDIDIPQVVHEWPKIATGRFEDTRIHIKPIEQIKMRERPELIRVHLVCDLSGSMDKPKKKVLKESAVLLLRSLEEFQTYLNMTRSLTNSKLNVDTEMWGFGTSAQVLKPSAGDKAGYPTEAGRAKLIKSIKSLDNELGETNDHEPLNGIVEQIERDSDLSAKIKNGKVMEIIIVVTDGGSSDSEAAKQALGRLESMSDGKIIVRAIQIGRVSKEEKKTFEDVWTNQGEAIGEKIENLPLAIQTILAKYLGSVKL